MQRSFIFTLAIILSAYGCVPAGSSGGGDDDDDDGGVGGMANVGGAMGGGGDVPSGGESGTGGASDAGGATPADGTTPNPPADAGPGDPEDGGTVVDPDGGVCPDSDGDGFRDAQCSGLPEEGGGDCDDGNGEVNPDAEEVCGNGIDDDCRGGDLACVQNCDDRDQDGFGEGAGCFGPDCDEGSAAVNPWSTEICDDRIDQNCDGRDAPCREACVDNDGDGFGVCVEQGCDCLGHDCNDQNPSINPGAIDVADDAVDQDCDGQLNRTREDCIDVDNDGYGQGAGCAGVDCNDRNPLVHTGRLEICGNGVDDDCRGGDNACAFGEDDCIDPDGDGYGEGACPNQGRDCGEGLRDVNPGAPEVQCNDIDDNCNGVVDECPNPNGVCQQGRCVALANCGFDRDCGFNEVCDESSQTCRLAPQENCEDRGQCETGAVCESNVCNPQIERCYRGLGMPCVDACECSGALVCADEGICVQCVADRTCRDDDRDVCAGSGLCVGTAAVGGRLDGRVSFLRALARCWSQYSDGGQLEGCAQVAWSEPLLVGGVPSDSLGLADDHEEWVCDDRQGGDAFDAQTYAVLREIFGCGIVDLINLSWERPIGPRDREGTCIYFVPEMSGFGFPDDTRRAVHVTNCAALPGEN